MDIIKINNLTKKYDNLVAVNDISFVVKKGELFAFLGLNGAGKSTTINIISGTLSKDSGKILIDSKDIDMGDLEIKKKIGIVFQNSVLDKNLTVKDNLIIRASLYNLEKEELTKNYKKVVSLFELEDLLNRKINTLSGGQRRRVDIARALVHNPSILIMDEPTTGLDPQTRNLLWNIITNLRAEGLTVFLTTHYMSEASSADYIIIIDEGKIKVKGTPLELKSKYANDLINVYLKNSDNLIKLLKEDNYKYNLIKEGISIEIENTLMAKEILKKYDKDINDFEVLKGDMDNVFLNVTGKELRGN